MLYLDGHCARLALRRNAKPMTYQHIVSESSYIPFLFSPLVVTGEKALLLPAYLELIMVYILKWTRRLDDDSYLDTSPSHSIGEIKLVIVRTTIPKDLEEQLTTYSGPPQLQMVHERSKKAIAHRVKYVAVLTLYNRHLMPINSYGSEIPRPPVPMTAYSAKPVERIVSFIFRYRPLGM